VMTWLLNSLEEKISGSVMFLSTTKDMWDTLKVMYGNEKIPRGCLRLFLKLHIKNTMYFLVKICFEPSVGNRIFGMQAC